MKHEKGHVVLGRQPNQGGEKQRPTGQVEGVVGGDRDQAGGHRMDRAGLFLHRQLVRRLERSFPRYCSLRQRREVDHRQAALAFGQALHGNAVDRYDDAAQHLMPASDLGDRSGQRPGPQLAFETKVGRQVVDRRVAVHLADEPEPFLGEGERRINAPSLGLTRHQRRKDRPVVPAAHRLDLQRQLSNGRFLEECSHRQARRQRATNARDDLRRQQGVAAEFEEVVPHADLRAAQDRAPDLGQDLLYRCRRRHVLPRQIRSRHRQAGQRLAIHLAVGRQGQRFQGHEGSGDHVVRQRGRQGLAQLGERRDLGALRRHKVAHQALIAGRDLAR